MVWLGLLKVAIHFSNLLFLVCFNLFPFGANLLLACLYLVYFRQDFSAPQAGFKKVLPVFFSTAILCLLIKFSYVFFNGFHTVPHWDYFKYNAILDDISKDLLRPSLRLSEECVIEKEAKSFASDALSPERQFAVSMSGAAGETLRLIAERPQGYQFFCTAGSEFTFQDLMSHHREYSVMAYRRGSEIIRARFLREPQTYPLSYYYAIFLPPVFLGKILSWAGFGVDVFTLQTLFNLWTVMVIALVIANFAGLMGKRAFLVLLLLFTLGGLDGLHHLVNPAIKGTFFGDLHDGGENAFFYPMRIQDFTSYLHSIPGHLMAGVVALLGVVFTEGKKTKKDEYRFMVALVLFVLSTSLFVAGVFILYLVIRTSRIHLRAGPQTKTGFYIFDGYPFKDKGVLMAVMAGMFFFYAAKRLSSASFLSFPVVPLGVGKYLLFILQELSPFVFLGVLFRIKDKIYWVSLAYLMGISLIGGLDIIMSSAILPVLYLIYRIATVMDLKNKKVLAIFCLFVALYAPTQVANLSACMDAHHDYKNGMGAPEARGIMETGLVSVLKVYVRK